jgi:hypothetical protein
MAERRPPRPGVLVLVAVLLALAFALRLDALPAALRITAGVLLGVGLAFVLGRNVARRGRR